MLRGALKNVRMRSLRRRHEARVRYESHASGPSVVLIRGSKVLPSQIGDVVAGVLTKYAKELEAGALIVIDDARQRVRVLPL